MVRGKITQAFSITKEGVKALLREELLDYMKDFVERLLEQEGVDTIVRVCLAIGANPISFIPYPLEKALNWYAPFVEQAAKTIPHRREYQDFCQWIRKADPSLYNDWITKKLSINVSIKKARPEPIEKMKMLFPLTSAQWGL
jgi:lysine/ornithine N-monooxygenase